MLIAIEGNSGRYTISYDGGASLSNNLSLPDNTFKAKDIAYCIQQPIVFVNNLTTS